MLGKIEVAPVLRVLQQQHLPVDVSQTIECGSHRQARLDSHELLIRLDGGRRRRSSDPGRPQLPLPPFLSPKLKDLPQRHPVEPGGESAVRREGRTV